MTAALDQISATIDEEVRTQLAELAAAHAGSSAGAVQVTELHGNLGAGTHLYRVSSESTAHADGQWSYVVKIFDLPGDGFTEASPDPNAWDYWKREWLVYQTPWAEALTGPVRRAKCLGSGEGIDRRLWIAVEDHAANDKRPWSLETFAVVSRHLGEFNARYLNAADRPDDDWLSRNWLQGWTERSESSITLLPKVAGNPLLAPIYPPHVIDRLLRLWEGRHTLYGVLDELPQTLCHLDVFPRNVFPVDGAHSVAIDWAFTGVAPTGQELSALVGASVALFEVSPSHAEELETECLRGYLEGLRSGGWNGDQADVELAYLVSNLLRWCLGSISPILTLLDESMHPYVEAGFGQPIPVVVDTVSQALEFLMKSTDRVRRLIEF